MKLLGKHERSVIGQTLLLAFTGTVASLTLVADPVATGPVFFILFTPQDVYLRQGPATGGIDATSSDCLLMANTYFKLTVTSLQDNTISALRVTTNGTLRCTNNSGDTPGVGVSA